MVAHSKFFNPSRSRRPWVESTALTIVEKRITVSSEAFVEIQTAGGADLCGWVAPDVLTMFAYPIIKCVSGLAAWYLGGAFSASAQDIHELKSDLCVCVGPPSDVDGDLPISCFALWRQFFAGGATIQFVAHLLVKETKGVDMSTSDRQSHTGLDLPVGFALQSVVPKHFHNRKWRCYKNDACVICLRGISEYKWSSCSHPKEGNEAILCTQCRNAVWTYILGFNSNKTYWHNRHALVSACPLRRSPGRIIRWIYSRSTT